MYHILFPLSFQTPSVSLLIHQADAPDPRRPFIMLSQQRYGYNTYNTYSKQTTEPKTTQGIVPTAIEPSINTKLNEKPSLSPAVSTMLNSIEGIEPSDGPHKVNTRLNRARLAVQLNVPDHMNKYRIALSAPGGYVDDGETPEQAARREALEEVCMIIVYPLPLK